MVDIMDVYNSLNISIVTVMENSEMLKFVSDHLKTKKMCKHAVKKLPFLIRYFPDKYKIQQKAILENGGTLKSIPDCYKNQGMPSKAVYNYPHALEFVTECCKTQKMSDKAVNTYLSTIKFLPECLMTQEICDEAVNRCVLYLIIFLIDIKPKKCVIELFF